MNLKLTFILGALVPQGILGLDGDGTVLRGSGGEHERASVETFGGETLRGGGYHDNIQRAHPGDGYGGLGRGQHGRDGGGYEPSRDGDEPFRSNGVRSETYAGKEEVAHLGRGIDGGVPGGTVHENTCVPGYNDWGKFTGFTQTQCYQFCKDIPECVTADYTGGGCYPSKAGVDKSVPYDNCDMWVKAGKTTLVAVKCIRPSDGMDPWVDDLIGWAVGAAVTIAGAAACGATAGIGCVALGAAASVGIGGATALFCANGGPEQMDKFFDNGEDDLYVTMNGSNVFPGGDDDISTGSQQTHYPNKSHGGTPKICIWDWDWPSADDNLGCVDTSTLDMGTNLVLLTSQVEGSIYQMEIRME